MKRAFVIFMIILLSGGCASIPPELLDSYTKANTASKLMMDRHQRTVDELVQNWYSERLSRLNDIRKNEISKSSYLIDHPKGTGKVKMVAEDDLLRIDKQYQEAMANTEKWRDSLIIGYADSENWQKLSRLNAVNLDWMKSFIGLSNEQRKLFKELTLKNIPYPNDVIIDKAKKLIQ